MKRKASENNVQLPKRRCSLRKATTLSPSVLSKYPVEPKHKSHKVNSKPKLGMFNPKAIPLRKDEKISFRFTEAFQNQLRNYLIMLMRTEHFVPVPGMEEHAKILMADHALETLEQFFQTNLKGYRPHILDQQTITTPMKTSLYLITSDGVVEIYSSMPPSDRIRAKKEVISQKLLKNITEALCEAPKDGIKEKHMALTKKQLKELKQIKASGLSRKPSQAAAMTKGKKAVASAHKVYSAYLNEIKQYCEERNLNVTANQQHVYAHILAHQFTHNVGQHPDNLSVATDQSNTVHLFAEQLIKRIIDRTGFTCDIYARAVHIPETHIGLCLQYNVKIHAKNNTVLELPFSIDLQGKNFPLQAGGIILAQATKFLLEKAEKLVPATPVRAGVFERTGSYQARVEEGNAKSMLPDFPNAPLMYPQLYALQKKEEATSSFEDLFPVLEQDSLSQEESSTVLSSENMNQKKKPASFSGLELQGSSPGKLSSSGEITKYSL